MNIQSYIVSFNELTVIIKNQLGKKKEESFMIKS